MRNCRQCASQRCQIGQYESPIPAASQRVHLPPPRRTRPGYRDRPADCAIKSVITPPPEPASHHRQMPPTRAANEAARRSDEKLLSTGGKQHGDNRRKKECPHSRTAIPQTGCRMRALKTEPATVKDVRQKSRASGQLRTISTRPKPMTNIQELCRAICFSPFIVTVAFPQRYRRLMMGHAFLSAWLLRVASGSTATGWVTLLSSGRSFSESL